MAPGLQPLGQLGSELLARRLVFVTGKGGVGKSSITAALARLSSRAGLKTLVCEVDAHFQEDLLEGVERVTIRCE